MNEFQRERQSNLWKRFSETYGKGIIKLVNKDQSLKKEIISKKDKDEELYDLWSKMKEDIDSDIEYDKVEKIIEFPDGYYWTTVECDDKSKEGRAMQHCGLASGDMYSLRDPQDKPHVTVDHVKESNTIPQLRGKQNSIPEKKYFKYIKELFKKLNDPRLTDGEFNADPEQFPEKYRQATEFMNFMDI